MTWHRRSRFVVTTRAAGALALVASSHFVPSPASAQEIDVRISGGGWIYSLGNDAEPCASPCERSMPPGELDLGFARAAAEVPHHRVRLVLSESAELHVGRRSREGERIAGAVTIIAGVVGGIAAFAGIAAAFDGDPYEGLAIGIVALPSAAAIVLSLSLLGALIVGLDDQPIVELDGGSGGRRRLAPDSAESRVFADIVVALALAGGVVGGGYALTQSTSRVAAFDTTIAIATVVTPAALTLAGHLGHGSGDIVAALVGWLFGVGTGAMVFAIGAAIAPHDAETWSLVGLSTAFGLGYVGGIVGYEVANARARRRVERVDAPPPVTVVPALAGIVGTF